jgi:hypothetical protein
LAFTDDDCEPDCQWLDAMASAFTEKPDAAVGGRTVNALQHNPYAITSQMLVDYLYSYYNETPIRRSSSPPTISLYHQISSGQSGALTPISLRPPGKTANFAIAGCIGATE